MNKLNIIDEINTKEEVFNLALNLIKDRLKTLGIKEYNNITLKDVIYKYLDGEVNYNGVFNYRENKIKIFQTIGHLDIRLILHELTHAYSLYSEDKEIKNNKEKKLDKTFLLMVIREGTTELIARDIINENNDLINIGPQDYSYLIKKVRNQTAKKIINIRKDKNILKEEIIEDEEILDLDEKKMRYNYFVGTNELELEHDLIDKKDDFEEFVLKSDLEWEILSNKQNFNYSKSELSIEKSSVETKKKEYMNFGKKISNELNDYYLYEESNKNGKTRSGYDDYVLEIKNIINVISNNTGTDISVVWNKWQKLYFGGKINLIVKMIKNSGIEKIEGINIDDILF